MNTPHDPFANIDLDAVPEGDNNYALIPNGEYSIRAINMEMKTSQNAGQDGNHGQMINVQFEITGPTHSGRIIFTNLNIVNDNETAVEIGLRELRSWMQACGKATSGKMSIERIYECIGMEFTAKVGVSRSKNPAYDDQNKITKYKKHPMTEATKDEPFVVPISAPAVQVAPAPVPGARPWERS